MSIAYTFTDPWIGRQLLGDRVHAHDILHQTSTASLATENLCASPYRCKLLALPFHHLVQPALLHGCRTCRHLCMLAPRGDLGSIGSRQMRQSYRSPYYHQCYQHVDRLGCPYLTNRECLEAQDGAAEESGNISHLRHRVFRRYLQHYARCFQRTTCRKRRLDVFVRRPGTLG